MWVACLNLVGSPEDGGDLGEDLTVEDGLAGDLDDGGGGGRHLSRREGASEPLREEYKENKYGRSAVTGEWELVYTNQRASSTVAQ